MHIPPLADGYYAVFLEDLRQHIRLGVTEAEVRPQPVRIDIAAIVKRLGPGDGIEDVVDYNHLRDAAVTLTDSRHFGLQETLCEALIETLCTHEGVAGVIVQTRKVAIYDDAGAVGCQMSAIAPSALR